MVSGWMCVVLASGVLCFFVVSVMTKLMKETAKTPRFHFNREETTVEFKAWEEEYFKSKKEFEKYGLSVPDYSYRDRLVAYSKVTGLSPFANDPGDRKIWRLR